jgi:hypothetical protein
VIILSTDESGFERNYIGLWKFKPAYNLHRAKVPDPKGRKDSKEGPPAAKNLNRPALRLTGMEKNRPGTKISSSVLIHSFEGFAGDEYLPILDF